MRLDRLFNHRLIMTPVASYIGLIAMVLAVWALVTGTVSLLYIIPLVIGWFFMLMSVTVGMHRYIAHNAFRCSTFWKVALSYLATLAIYGSTIQWSAMHISHHRYSDTPKDPHYTGWRYLFWKKNNPTEFNRKTLRRLARDPLQHFLHKYYALVVFATVAALALVDPWLLVFLYLAPLGWLHLVGSMHQVFAHDKHGPMNQILLEWFLPTGGEWLHRHHHEKAGDIRFGHSDMGYWFIRLIRSR